LIPGRSYIYDIRSFNLNGLSDPVFVSGNTSSIVKLSSDIFNASGQIDIISNAPTNLIGSPSNSQVSLSWIAPNNIKGTLNNYLVVYGLLGQPSQSVLTNSVNNSYNLGQLINFSTYYIKVAPVYYDYANVISSGDFSQTIFSTPIRPVEPIYLANGFISVLTNDTISQDEFSNAALSNGYLSALYIDTIVIPLPNAPTSLSATAGNAQIVLSWTAPTNTNISDYTIEYTPSGGSAQTVNTGSTSTSYTLTGLTNGTAYTVRVAAVNSVGTGSYTAASSSVTPNAASVPGAPTSLRSSRGYDGCNDYIAVWNAPSSNGGSAITGYVWRIRGGATTNVAASTGTAETGSAYTGGRLFLNTSIYPQGLVGSLEVAAVNAVGRGPFASVTVYNDCN
jgi:hypothetical protein